jgi:Mrp family chromosome partitioning ATPase
VIAIIASTAGDGEQVAARGVASSLASAGYSTLFVDASLSSQHQSKSGPGLSLDEIGLLKSTPEPKPGIVAVMTLGDPTRQKTTSQRDVRSAFSIFQSRFDYVVISAEYGASKSFATSVFNAADAVVVSVRKGRREQLDDARLAAALEGIGSRFLGLVALDPATIENYSLATNISTTLGVRRGRTTAFKKEHKRRENAEGAI